MNYGGGIMDDDFYDFGKEKKLAQFSDARLSVYMLCSSRAYQSLTTITYHR